MTHLPYIVASYALGVLVPASYARGGLHRACAPRGAGWPRSIRGPGVDGPGRATR